jgi:hypothetical protein
MSKELSNNAKLVGFITMDSFIILDKAFLEELLPEAIKLAEAFANITIEFIECLFLIGALNNHGG